MSRCEGHRKHGGPFTFGPVTWVQCNNRAEVILDVTQPDTGREQLPACKVCWNEAIAKDGIIIHGVVPILHAKDDHHEHKAAGRKNKKGAKKK